MPDRLPGSLSVRAFIDEAHLAVVVNDGMRARRLKFMQSRPKSAAASQHRRHASRRRSPSVSGRMLQ